MHLITTTPAAAPVLTAADVRAHARTPSTDDGYLETLIAAATSWVEAWLGRALVNRTYTYKVDGFPGQCVWSDPPTWQHGGEILLPYPTLQSVTSVTYRDTETTTATLNASTEYEVDTGSLPGRIRLRYGASWPNTLGHPQSVTIVYVAGFGMTGEMVPEQIRHAIRLLVAHLYENREATSPLAINQVPYGIEALLMPWRCFTRFA